jgi:hypothetical protein
MPARREGLCATTRQRLPIFLDCNRDHCCSGYESARPLRDASTGPCMEVGEDLVVHVPEME